MRRLIAGIFFVLFCFSSAAAIEMVSVSGENVYMRNGPGQNQAMLWELSKGFPLMVIGADGKWLKIEDFEGDVGWVHKDLVDKTPHLIVKVSKNFGKTVNMRSGPGKNYRVTGKAAYGVVFKTLEHKNSWVKVRHENGMTGWVKRSLLWGW